MTPTYVTSRILKIKNPNEDAEMPPPPQPQPQTTQRKAFIFEIFKLPTFFIFQYLRPVDIKLFKVSLILLSRLETHELRPAITQLTNPYTQSPKQNPFGPLKMDFRVMGGQTAKAHSWPWQDRIRSYKNLN